MTQANLFRVPPVATYAGVDEAKERVAQQMRLVENLTPGTKPHKTASNVLFLLQDSMLVMEEARATLAAARAASKRRQRA